MCWWPIFHGGGIIPVHVSDARDLSCSRRTGYNIIATVLENSFSGRQRWFNYANGDILLNTS